MAAKTGVMERTELRPRSGPTTRRWVLVPVVIVALVGVWLLLSVAQTGPSAERILNPEPRPTHFYDGVPRAEPPLWGINSWGLIIQLGALAGATAIWGYFIRLSLRHRAWHPGLIACCALTSLVVQDPWSNWAPYAAYDPRLLHWPVTWAWASQSPTVEPLFVIPGYVAAFMPCLLLTLAVYRRFVVPRVREGGWFHGHPVFTLWITGWSVALVWDTVVEMFFVHTGFYTFTQVISWGSINAGSTTQFPWLWEVPSVAIIYASGSALLWRDDRGQTIAHRAAARMGLFPHRPALGALAVAAVMMNLTFMVYNAYWTGLRMTRLADTVARPWRYQDTKVYDPQGVYQRAGEPGPYFPGILSGPME